jgi:hypothetical protein
VNGGDLKVPVAALPAELLLAGGAAVSGRIFVPAVASRHEGPTRPDEWVNEATAFFPFLADESERPVLVNKAAVVALSVPAWADEPALDETVPSPHCGVAVDCGEATFRGFVTLDVPAHQGRMLDVLNLPGAFLTVRDRERHHLVNKRHIVRVVEERSG